MKAFLSTIFLLLFTGIYTNAQETNTFGYTGTIGTLKTELILKLSISKDECIYEFEGSYFNKKLNKDMILKATLKPCENENEDPDKKITLTEYDGDLVTGTLVLTGIGEVSCNGNWISPNGKKKITAHFVAIKEKEIPKEKKK
jgi:hypothetical protein